MTTTAVDLPTLIDAMRPVARRVMLTEFTPDCCVATARVLRRAFEYFGFRAEAVPVTVQVFNPGMVRLLASGMRLPANREERLRLFTMFNAHGVGIVAASSMGKKDRFGGHLVLNVEGMLVDASLEQAERPLKNMLLDPLIAFTPERDFFASRAEREVVTETYAGNCRVVYQRLGDASFRTSPDWQRTGSPYVEVLRTILDQTKERLNMTNKPSG